MGVVPRGDGVVMVVHARVTVDWTVQHVHLAVSGGQVTELPDVRRGEVW